MSIATDLYATLNAASGVRAYVGTADSPQQSRIYPSGNVPESAAFPHIAYFTTARSPISTLAGSGDAHQHVVQIDSHARTFAEAQAIADAVHAALEGNGSQEARFDFYDERVKAHIASIEWLFID